MKNLGRIENGKDLVTKEYVDTEITGVKTDLTTHTSDTDIHVTATDKTNWNNTSIVLDISSVDLSSGTLTSEKAEELYTQINNILDENHKLTKDVFLYIAVNMGGASVYNFVLLSSFTYTSGLMFVLNFINEMNSITLSLGVVNGTYSGEIAVNSSQSDWECTDEDSPAYIQNKPTIPTVTNDLTDELKAQYDTAYENNHTHSNKEVLDNTTASYTTEEKTKLSGIAENANNYTLPTASTTVLGGVKVDGTTITADESGVISSNSNGVEISPTAPENTAVLWIDTGNGGVAKYYDGAAWVAIAAAEMTDTVTGAKSHFEMQNGICKLITVD